MEIVEIFKIIRKNLNHTVNQNDWKIGRGGFVDDLRKSITKSKKEILDIEKKGKKFRRYFQARKNSKGGDTIIYDPKTNYFYVIKPKRRGETNEW